MRQYLEKNNTGSLTAEAKLQASLSTSMGGFGLRYAAIYIPAGHIASLIDPYATSSILIIWPRMRKSPCPSTSCSLWNAGPGAGKS